MDRVARVSAGSVLLAARRTQVAMASAVQSGVDSASAAVAHQKRWRAAEVLASIALAAQLMGGSLRTAIADGAHQARRVSRKRLAVELAAAGALAGGSRVIDRYAASDEDALRAGMAADALTAAWRGMVFAEAVRAHRAERSVAAAVAKTGRTLAPRLETTAKTEISYAYNEEHRAALYDMREDLAVEVMRRWDSANDSRTCDHCWHHDGETVGLDEDFSGGDMPGEMHPRCMCVETIVAAERARKVA